MFRTQVALSEDRGTSVEVSMYKGRAEQKPGALLLSFSCHLLETEGNLRKSLVAEPVP